MAACDATSTTRYLKPITSKRGMDRRRPGQDPEKRNLILSEISRTLEEESRSPTYREIAARTGITLQNVYHYIRAMQDDGLVIINRRNQHRSIRLPDMPADRLARVERYARAARYYLMLEGSEEDARKMRARELLKDAERALRPDDL